MPVKLVVEASKSRSGKHAERKLAFVVVRDEVRPVGEASCANATPVKPTYSRGRACEVLVDIPAGGYAVQLRLVKNLWGRVKGYVRVYDRDGVLLYEAAVRKLKVRPARGDYRLHWVVEKVVEYLKLDRVLKRYRLPPRLYRALKSDSGPAPG